MQMHYRFDIKNFSLVNNGIRKTIEVELAVITMNFTPSFRLIQNPAEGDLVFLQKIAA